MPSRAGVLQSLRRQPRPARLHPSPRRHRSPAREPAPLQEVSRAALVNRLRAARSLPLASIVAPTGYGKTALLRQWATRDGRPFAFVALERGVDAAGLEARIAVAIGLLAAGDLVPAGSRRAESRRSADTLHWLAAALGAAEPFVLVLDDAHLLDAGSADVVTTLVRHVPAGSTIVLSGRGRPLPSIPRLRASGLLLELGPGDLALTPREARALIGASRPTADDRLVELMHATEGWPAGIAAAARSPIGLETSSTLREDLLAALPPEARAFLRRTSVLERLCAPLCDAVLEAAGGARGLASLAASGPVLGPLDRSGEWFRQHRAFRTLLRTELDAQEPLLVPLLERRAAGWFAAYGEPESALRHARRAGDVDLIAGILDAVSLQMHHSGRDEALLPVIAALGDSRRLEDRPSLAAFAARLHAQHGDAQEAERLLDLATSGAAPRARGRDGAVDPRILLVRAAVCADGVESMLAGAQSALDELPVDDRWRPYGLLLQGSACALLGEVERADAILGRAVHEAERLGSTETRVVALTERSLLAAAGGRRPEADRLLALAVAAMDAARLTTYPTCALTLAASARSHLLHGRALEAESSLAAARRLTAGLTHALPWLAVQSRLELVRAYVTLQDAGNARALLREIGALLAARPRLGVLRRQRDRIAAEMRTTPAGLDGRAAVLTSAEIKLLPMLATHMSFREIGLRFFLSRNTVKTQAISVYRKLGASSRSEAVARACRLGLIEPGVDSEALILTG